MTQSVKEMSNTHTHTLRKHRFTEVMDGTKHSREVARTIRFSPQLIIYDAKTTALNDRTSSTC